MADEKFLTNYTEQDIGDYVTLTDPKIDFSGLPRDEDVLVYADKGIDHFDDDFEHLYHTKQTARSATNGGNYISWMLANIISDRIGIADVNEDALVVQNNCGAGITRVTWTLHEIDSGTLYSDDYHYELGEGQDFHPVIERDESVGTYGTIYCHLYDDANRTNLVTTLSVALHSSKKNYRYIYGLNTINTGTANFSIDGFIQNLDLQEAVTIKGIAGIFGLGKLGLR